MRRLSYHGWAALLLVAEFLLVVGGMALVASSSSAITLPNGDLIAISCASSSAAAAAQCAGSEARETFGVLVIGAGFLLFGGQLLVGMLIAGVRDALANAPRPSVVTTAGPEPSHPAPQA